MNFLLKYLAFLLSSNIYLLDLLLFVLGFILAGLDLDLVLAFDLYVHADINFDSFFVIAISTVSKFISLILPFKGKFVIHLSVYSVGGDGERMFSRFNSNTNCVLAVFDETCLGKDKNSISRLKSLVTDNARQMEQKNHDGKLVWNYTNIFSITNDISCMKGVDPNSRRFQFFKCNNSSSGLSGYHKFMHTFLKSKYAVVVYCRWLGRHMRVLLGDDKSSPIIPPVMQIYGDKPEFNKEMKEAVTQSLDATGLWWNQVLDKKRIEVKRDSRNNHNYPSHPNETRNDKPYDLSSKSEEFRSNLRDLAKMMYTESDAQFYEAAVSGNNINGLFEKYFPMYGDFPVTMDKSLLYDIFANAMHSRVPEFIFLKNLEKFVTLKVDEKEGLVHFPCLYACKAQYDFYLRNGEISDDPIALDGNEDTWISYLPNEANMVPGTSHLSRPCVLCSKCSKLWVAYSELHGIGSFGGHAGVPGTSRLRTASSKGKEGLCEAPAGVWGAERAPDSPGDVPPFAQGDRHQAALHSSLDLLQPGCTGPAEQNGVRGKKRTVTLIYDEDDLKEDEEETEEQRERKIQKLLGEKNEWMEPGEKKAWEDSMAMLCDTAENLKRTFENEGFGNNARELHANTVRIREEFKERLELCFPDNAFLVNNPEGPSMRAATALKKEFRRLAEKIRQVKATDERGEERRLKQLEKFTYTLVERIFKKLQQQEEEHGEEEEEKEEKE